jgi:uncharacterized protein YndB with AHSA1/START domain
MGGRAVPTQISPYHVRRAAWIDATTDEVWEEFTDFERMRAWYGTGHTLTEYEPRLGGIVETAIDLDGAEHLFRGEVVAFEPGRELSFEQLWMGSDWQGPTTVTIRLSPHDGGTLVELFHHGYERLGGRPGDHLDGFESGWTTRQLHALRDLVRR